MRRHLTTTVCVCRWGWERRERRERGDDQLHRARCDRSHSRVRALRRCSCVSRASSNSNTGAHRKRRTRQRNWVQHRATQPARSHQQLRFDRPHHALSPLSEKQLQSMLHLALRQQAWMPRSPRAPSTTERIGARATNGLSLSDRRPLHALCEASQSTTHACEWFDVCARLIMSSCAALRAHERAAVAPPKTLRVFKLT